jgi:hypothetical protein
VSRQTIKTVGLAIGSFVLGAVVVGGPIVWWSAVKSRDDYYTRILEVTNIAYHIREGRQQELLRTCEESIWQSLQAADSLWGDDEARLHAFRYVESYYTRFKIEVPHELKRILEKRPPRPPSEAGRLRETATRPGAKTE